MTYANQVRSNSRGRLFIFRELSMGGGCRMNDEGLRITNIGQITSKFQAINSFASFLSVTLNTKAENATKGIAPQQLKSQLIRLMRL